MHLFKCFNFSEVSMFFGLLLTLSLNEVLQKLTLLEALEKIGN